MYPQCVHVHLCTDSEARIEWSGYSMIVTTSAVVDKRFVDKIGNKTAILRKYNTSTKYCFVDIKYYFEKERIHLKQII